MPLFRRSEKFRCFWRILPFFLRLQRSGPRKSGKCEVRNNNIIQRNYEIKEATIFKKLIYNFISAKQLLVLPITFFFFFCESSIKCDSEIIILKWSPPSREIGKKSESLWWVWKLGKGKWNTEKFHVAGFPVNREIYNTKTFLHSKIYKLLSAVGLYALPHSCSIGNNNWMT